MAIDVAAAVSMRAATVGDWQQQFRDDSLSINARVNEDQSVDTSAIVNDASGRQNVLVYFEPDKNAVEITDIYNKNLDSRDFLISKTANGWRAQKVTYVDGQQQSADISLAQIGSVDSSGQFHTRVKNADIVIPSDFREVDVTNTDTGRSKALLDVDTLPAVAIQPGDVISDLTIAGAQTADKRVLDAYGSYISNSKKGEPAADTVVSQGANLFAEEFTQRHPDLAYEAADIVGESYNGKIFMNSGYPHKRPQGAADGVLEHEMLHYYASDRFDVLMGRLYDTGRTKAVKLWEGVTEHLARELVPVTDYHKQVFEAIDTPEADWVAQQVGEDTLRKAYFEGDRAALNQIADLYA